MNKLKCSLAAKITAVILSAVLAAVCAVSVFFSAVLISARCFQSDRPGDAFLERKVIEDVSDRVLDYYRVFLEDNKTAVYGFEQEFKRENSNLFFTVTSDGRGTLSNYSDENYRLKVQFDDYVDINSTEKVYRFDSFSEEQAFISENKSRCEWSSWIESENGKTVYLVSVFEKETVPVTVTAYLCRDLTAADRYAGDMYLFVLLANHRNAVLITAIVSLIALLALFVFLMCSAGHRNSPSTGWVEKIPFDLILAWAVGACLFMAYCIAEASEYTAAVLAVLFASAAWSAVILTCMTFSARAKAGKWWRNTVIFILLRFLKRISVKVLHMIKAFFGCIPAAWRVLTVFGAVSLAELIALIVLRYDGIALLIFWLFEKAGETALLTVLVRQLIQLRDGGRQIADGNTAYKIDTSGMFRGLRQHGDILNGISHSIDIAIEQSMKSERLKTELITNVSHDIKTPLTSIVNYAGLLRSALDDRERSEQYIDVIERQSARLKKLTEDIVEASKASTGNISLQLESTDVNVLLEQACGEYGERLNDRGIEPVLTLSELDPHIMADGRHLWRVFDNLLGNVCKYAQTGTRMYLSSQVSQNKVSMIFKNISAQPLNISADELTGRFVRGDRSRNTEGSGLGLSIAESLVRAQGGAFSVNIDGDLFKVTVTFPMQ